MQEMISKCEADGDITISGASVANNSSLTWTVVSGTGLLTEVNTETPKYSPSELDWTNGSVTLKLTAIGNEGCDNAEDQVTINLISSPKYLLVMTPRYVKIALM